MAMAAFLLAFALVCTRAPLTSSNIRVLGFTTRSRPQSYLTSLIVFSDRISQSHGAADTLTISLGYMRVVTEFERPGKV